MCRRLHFKSTFSLIHFFFLRILKGLTRNKHVRNHASSWSFMHRWQQQWRSGGVTLSQRRKAVRVLFFVSMYSFFPRRIIIKIRSNHLFNNVTVMGCRRIGQGPIGGPPLACAVPAVDHSQSSALHQAGPATAPQRQIQARPPQRARRVTALFPLRSRPHRAPRRPSRPHPAPASGSSDAARALTM